MVSMVGDKYGRKDEWPMWPDQIPFPEYPKATPGPNDIFAYVSHAEFEKLKADFLKMKAELDDAKKQDIANGEPNCEMDEKVDVIQQIGDMLKMELGNLFKK